MKYDRFKNKKRKSKNNCVAVEIISQKEIEDNRVTYKNQDVLDLIYSFNDLGIEEINPASPAKKLRQQTDEVFLKKLRKKLEERKEKRKLDETIDENFST